MTKEEATAQCKEVFDGEQVGGDPEYTRGWHSARQKIEANAGNSTKVEHLIRTGKPQGIKTENYRRGWADYMHELAIERGTV